LWYGRPPKVLTPLDDLELLEALEDEGLTALADQAEAQSVGQRRVPLAEVTRESGPVP